jgi:polysaccharide biosynthesis/export protein
MFKRSMLRCLCASAFLATSAMAQNAPTPEQMQALQALTAEQQEALLRQAAQQQRQVAPSATEKSAPMDTATAERRRGQDAQNRQRLPGVLQPEDTLVIDLALPGTWTLEAPKGETRPQSGANEPPRRLRPVPTPSLDIETRRRFEDLVTQVKARNPYRLDRNGQLLLPGFAPIELSGLTETQALQRLTIDPTLQQFDMSIALLPVDKMGIQGLKRFGYELFNEAPSTFAPVTDVPVPADYIVGPGDQFRVQLFGSQSRTLPLVVSREGTISFPDFGPIRVAGLTFSAARDSIESQVARRMIGVRASVSMGDLRSIRVFVLGEARQPGTYTVSGLATMTAALFASGGVTDIGSLRDIQLKRQGTVVRRLDLYDLLIRGDTADDAKLQPGDVIFVPPVGPTVSVQGEVRRPAIYELRGEAGFDSLIQMAGGATVEADLAKSSITRVDERYRRVVLDVNLGSSAGRGLPLRDGDEVRIARLRPQLDSGVVVDGFVYRRGPVAWREGMRISDVIGSIDELMPSADAHYLLVRREVGPERRIQALSADIAAALAQRGGTADIALMPRDRVTVFDLAPGRERIIQPLMEELRLQAGLANPTEVVRIEGSVKVPGDYPLEPGMRISDLLRAGGSLESGAFGTDAELTRYVLDAAGARRTELVKVNLADILKGDGAANLELRAFDYLSIKETPGWSAQGSVVLKGEFRFPGRYPLRRGETLYDVMQRAGGLTDRAFSRGGVFTRVHLRENEKEQIKTLARRMQSDLAALSLQAAAANQSGASQALVAGQNMLEQLKDAQPVGRMVIDLPGLLSSGTGSPRNVDLRDGDELMVPQIRQDVTVIGEVQNATSHQYREGLSRSDYLNLSGGVTRKADKRRIYVVRADGNVATQGGGWLARSYDLAIQPGDTIVVPLDAERMPRLPFWQAVTQIIYNLAVSVAAVNSF